MEYEEPKESNSAHKIDFKSPKDESIMPLDKINIQRASKKIAGVRIKACRMFGKYFFIIMVGKRY